LNTEWSWSSQADIGAGGSNFSYMLNTEVNWKFAENWTTRFYGQVLSIDYEDGNEGDADWYLYVAKKFGAGLTINYDW
jgi:hypothetical protein